MASKITPESISAAVAEGDADPLDWTLHDEFLMGASSDVEACVEVFEAVSRGEGEIAVAASLILGTFLAEPDRMWGTAMQKFAAFPEYDSNPERECLEEVSSDWYETEYWSNGMQHLLRALSCSNPVFRALAAASLLRAWSTALLNQASPIKCPEPLPAAVIALYEAGHAAVDRPDVWQEFLVAVAESIGDMQANGCPTVPLEELVITVVGYCGSGSAQLAVALAGLLTDDQVVLSSETSERALKQLKLICEQGAVPGDVYNDPKVLDKILRAVAECHVLGLGCDQNFDLAADFYSRLSRGGPRRYALLRLAATRQPSAHMDDLPALEGDTRRIIAALNSTLEQQVGCGVADGFVSFWISAVETSFEPVLLRNPDSSSESQPAWEESNGKTSVCIKARCDCEREVTELLRCHVSNAWNSDVSLDVDEYGDVRGSVELHGLPEGSPAEEWDREYPGTAECIYEDSYGFDPADMTLQLGDGVQVRVQQPRAFILLLGVMHGIVPEFGEINVKPVDEIDPNTWDTYRDAAIKLATSYLTNGVN